MISMTGFGKSELDNMGRTLLIEIKTVNHRFFDVNIRLPRILLSYEDLIKKILQDNIERGHIDVFVTYKNSTEHAQQVILDEDLAQSYCEMHEKMAELFSIKNDLSTTVLSSYPDIITREAAEEDSEALTSLITDCTKLAVDSLNNMRYLEGDKLRNEFNLRLQNVADYVDSIEERAPIIVDEYREKLKTRIEDYLQNSIDLDEARLINEVAFFCDKANIDEEITRLHSHISHFYDIMEDTGAVGRKLDFLIQEMNREVNTIGSKSNDLNITNLVVLLKTELEKIREQVQNIE